MPEHELAADDNRTATDPTTCDDVELPVDVFDDHGAVEQTDEADE